MTSTIQFAIFQEEGEFQDHEKDLLCVCASPEIAEREVKSRAEKFLAGVSTSSEKELIRESNLSYEARIGKMGYGPRQVFFSVMETELVSS